MQIQGVYTLRPKQPATLTGDYKLPSFSDIADLLDGKLSYSFSS